MGFTLINLKIFTFMKLKNTSIFALAIILFSTVIANAQWVNRYNGQGDYSDRFTSIKSDASGNVYLAGSTVISNDNQDILVMKLDANGNEVWRNVYNATASGVDAALAITLDTSGNIYITGFAKFNSTATDIITIKYNPSGVIEWVASYGFTTDQYEQGNSVVVDASGNVFVTGQSDPDSTTTASDDYVVLKYNSTGVQQWVQRTNGTGNGIDRPSKIVLDPTGNPVVTGRSDNQVNYDYLTVKYDAATGAPLWSVRYDRTHNDWATDLVINPSNGNIYVTGRSKNTDYDYATVCYNTSGVQQWATIYDNAIGDNRATNIGIDAAGNLYVTGQSDVGTTAVNYDITTLKYNSAGVQQWISTYSGTALNDDIPTGFYVNSAGNIFITGSTDSDATATVSNNYISLKYASAGTLQWSKTYTSTSSSNDVSKAIIEDAFGNVIVTGSSETIPEKDGVTVKYNTSGVAQWTKIFNEGGDNSDKSNAMAMDSAGNTFIAGSVVEYGTDKNFALQKISTAGVTSWIKTTNGTSVGSSDSAQAVIVDPTGAIYVAGYTHNKGSATDMTIAKYDTNGNQIWINNYDFITESDRATAIGLDSSNNVYVTGRSDSDTSNLISNDDIVTLKYSSSGVLIWSKRYNGTANLSDIGRAMKVTPAGNVYIVGRVANANNNDIAVLKYNASGVQQWISFYNGGGNDEAFFMDIDSNENVYVTGNSENSTLTNTDVVTLKFNSAGVQQWVKRLDNGGNDITDAIKLDAAGNVIVAGTLDSDTSATTINNNMGLVKYDTYGTQLWLATYNGTANADDQASDIAIDASNNIYLTGTTNGTANYDYATLKYTPTGVQSNVLTYDGTASGSDIPQCIIFKSNFVYVTGSSFGTNAQSDFTTVKYNTNTLSIANVEGLTNQFKVYPNPATNFIKIDLSDIEMLELKNLKLTIVDMVGRTVLSSDNITQTVFELSIDNLKTGNYILQLSSGNQKIGFKKIIIN
jgi:uncharacterized delta-60 repeat protein